MFPDAKVECARFKGTGTEEFLDQKVLLSTLGYRRKKLITLYFGILIKQQI